MSSPYTGNPAGGPNLSPSSAPGPGIEPTINVPADGDPANASTMFAQQYQSLADYVAYLQNCVRFAMPHTAAAGSEFSTVSTSLFGGTVTPSGTPNPFFYRWLIKIQTGGAVGTATFKTSIDGGTTFGALQTTAASMTDATTGITLAFSGTFTANGTAAFYNAILPQAAWLDSGGGPKFSIDYLGYPLGNRLFDFRENWVDNTTTAGAGTGLAFGSQWQSTASGSAVGASITGAGTFSFPGYATGTYYPTPMAWIGNGTTLNAYTSIFTRTPIVAPNANQIVVLEWDAYLLSQSGSWRVAMGFDIGVPFAATLKGARFDAGPLVSATANWFAASGTGSASTETDTTIAYANNTVTRFRIEIHPSTSPYGNCVRYFINGTLTNSITSGLVPTDGSASLYATFYASSGDTTTARALFIGGVRCCTNRFSTISV